MKLGLPAFQGFSKCRGLATHCRSSNIEWLGESGMAASWQRATFRRTEEGDTLSRENLWARDFVMCDPFTCYSQFPESTHPSTDYWVIQPCLGLLLRRVKWNTEAVGSTRTCALAFIQSPLSLSCYFSIISYRYGRKTYPCVVVDRGNKSCTRFCSSDISKSNISAQIPND